MNENEVRVLSKLREKFGTVKPASNGWVRIACPTCTARDKKKFKRYVHLDRLFNRCFICEMPMQEAELVGDQFIRVSGTAQSTVELEPKKENPMARQMPGLRFIPVNQLPLDHPAVKFLHKDHLFDLDRYATEYGICYCPCDAGMTFSSRPFISSAERLIFPVRFNNELVGWQMRSIPGTTYGDREDAVKYYHLFNKGQYLFNYDKARQYQTVVLVEGVKKALKLPNAVACFGKDLTDAQVQLLTNWKNIIVCLDAQDVAQAIGRRVAASLRAYGLRALNVDLGPYGFPSPDEMTTDQLSFTLYNEWRNYEHTDPL